MKDNRSCYDIPVKDVVLQLVNHCPDCSLEYLHHHHQHQGQRLELNAMVTISIIWSVLGWWGICPAGISSPQVRIRSVKVAIKITDRGESYYKKALFKSNMAQKGHRLWNTGKEK